jgi:hypothetical protein
VLSGEWEIGRIYERHGFPEDVRFYWSLRGIVLTRQPSIHTDGAAATLDAAKAEFRKSWNVGGAGRLKGRPNPRSALSMR